MSTLSGCVSGILSSAVCELFVFISIMSKSLCFQYFINARVFCSINGLVVLVIDMANVQIMLCKYINLNLGS